MTDPLLDELIGAIDETERRTRQARVRANPEDVERGLAGLVLTLIEFLRQAMERQAIRRMENGTLTEDEIERLGETFMKLESRMNQLKAEFGLGDEDLNIDLGPLGNLM